MYAWPLLETLLSEILTKDEWLMVWDNILSNHPSFLLMFVVSYLLCSRKALLQCTRTEDFEVYLVNWVSTVLENTIQKVLELKNSKYQVWNVLGNHDNSIWSNRMCRPKQSPNPVHKLLLLVFCKVIFYLMHRYLKHLNFRLCNQSELLLFCCIVFFPSPQCSGHKRGYQGDIPPARWNPSRYTPKTHDGRLHPPDQGSVPSLQQIPQVYCGLPGWYSDSQKPLCIVLWIQSFSW